MATTLADFINPYMRVLLDDNDPADAEFTDAQLKDALKSSYMLGGWPEGYTLTAEAVAPDVTNLRDFGIIVCESVVVLKVGAVGAYSWKSRPLAETDHGDGKRDLLLFCRQRLAELRDTEAVFSTRQSLAAFLAGGAPGATLQVDIPPASTVAVAWPSIYSEIIP